MRALRRAPCRTPAASPGIPPHVPNPRHAVSLSFSTQDISEPLRFLFSLTLIGT